MSAKKVTPQQNQANQANQNKGTSGTNKQNADVNGNRGKQMNPNQSVTRNLLNNPKNQHN